MERTDVPATRSRRQTRPRRRDAGSTAPARVHFLDVGAEEYGDAVLCLFGETRILIDGAHPGNQVGSVGHPSIPEQLQTALSTKATPITIDLLIVTHAHQDHIGCLPWLIEHQVIDPKWALVTDPQLGWGRAIGEEPSPPPDARVINVVAALREEVPSRETDDATLATFLADAASLETLYKTMLETLKSRGTRVVRHGRDSPAALLTAFRNVGLEILGPSEAQLVVCAETIARRTDAAISFVTDAASQADASTSATDLYRSLVADADAADTVARPGPAINLQSIVTRFRSGASNVLFAGDMQFAHPQVANPDLTRELAALRQHIAQEAPYSLVKLSHHGSDNAFDAGVLAELGATPLYGICAGEGSTAHPNPSVLRLLESERQRLNWVRTDHNGLATIELDGEAKISVNHGQISDPRPNAPDVATSEATSAAPEPTVQVTRSALGSQPESSNQIKVVTRIPPGVERLTMTVEVARTGEVARAAVATDAAPDLTLASGRHLPLLLFVTSSELLAAGIGTAETEAVMAAIRAAHQPLYDLPAQATDPAQATAAVRTQLGKRPDLQGVVVVGGYDVVPSQRLDCLPTPLRQQLGHTNDPDDFLVWNDDAYGDRDGDLMPELPVSRVPDGKSAELLFAALSAADHPRDASRRGVRNVARPFAESVFGALPGHEVVAVSEPTTFQDAPPLDAEHVYLMLHGDFVDSSRFWGEGTAGNREAVNLTNIPGLGGRVVFTGCCWGALIADQPALRALPGTVPGAKVAPSSMALTFLQAGATAFVGCTGAHYSPTDRPYKYFGGPMHEAFWQALLGGASPARALLAAKIDYLRGFPHGRSSPQQQAIEHKILSEYTCLGLGW